MEVCKHCKNFQRLTVPDDSSFGYCESPKMIYLNAYRDVDSEKHIKCDSLVFRDGDGFASPPLVGELFGCIHFEGTEQYFDEWVRKYDC